jgi:outer membrane protein OmpA-like peptidoglycan-associated protein
MDAIEYVRKKVLCSAYKYLLLICFSLLLTTQLNAQTEDRPIWLSFHIGHQEYRGDLGNEFLEYAFGTNWVLGYQGSMYFSPSFDLGLNLSIGELDIQNGFSQGNPALSETAFSKTYLNTSLFGRFKFANGNILPENSLIQPYLNAGIGFTAYGGGDENLKNGLTLTIPGTIGFDIPVNETIKFYAQSTYNRTFADGFDGSDGLDGRNHDDYLVYAAGVKVALSASKRESQQGISEPDYDAPILQPVAEMAAEAEESKEMEEPEEVVSDSRSEKFTNEKEKPMESTDGEGNGLGNEIEEQEEALKPEGDGFSDKMEDLEQIPDSDDDGLNDEMDACPQTAGADYLNGCPDSDDDTLDDTEDECPGEPGLRRLSGCPEEEKATESTAGDEKMEMKKPEAAVEEERENPPETLVEEEEPAEKDSMQAVSDALKKRVDVIYNHLQYMPGKALIMDSSRDDLDNLAQILRENPKLQLIIEGYTDSKGEASYNLLLSKDRADAVKQYLMGRGIDEIRLRAEGYGEISPKTTNDTEAGRAENRRVELRLTHHWVLSN